MIKGSSDGDKYTVHIQQNGVTNEFTLAMADQRSDELALVDFDVENMVMMLSGIYGQVLSDKSSKRAYKKGSEFSSFAASKTNKYTCNHITATLSDQNGFYQLALTAGDYEICLDGIQKCSSATFGDAFPLQRRDLSNNDNVNCRNIQPEANIINQ